MLLVVIDTAEVARASEGLRAALGLGLRQDVVEVLLVDDAASMLASEDPRVVRALGTLARLGRPAKVASRDQARVAASRARHIEVWTAGRGSPEGGRTLRLRRGGQDVRRPLGPGAVDTDDLIEQILSSDAASVW